MHCWMKTKGVCGARVWRGGPCGRRTCRAPRTTSSWRASTRWSTRTSTTSGTCCVTRASSPASPRPSPPSRARRTGTSCRRRTGRARTARMYRWSCGFLKRIIFMIFFLFLWKITFSTANQTNFWRWEQPRNATCYVCYVCVLTNKNWQVYHHLQWKICFIIS